MKVLIDTNVLIDFMAKRQPYYHEAEKILLMCSEGELDGFVAAHSITNAFYILWKYSPTEIRQILTEMCNILTVVGIDKERLIKSLSNLKFDDIEDCLQSVCANECNADYIITRNINDFEFSYIKPITPTEFLQSVNV